MENEKTVNLTLAQIQEIKSDEIRIDKAREKFRMKEFNNSIEGYNSVENKNLITELDKKIIEFCNLHLKVH